MSKYTPGPWAVNDMGTDYVVHSKGRIQARTDHHTPEDLANARLMATAPLMLKMLETIANDLAREQMSDEDWNNVRRVIAKATGK